MRRAGHLSFDAEPAWRPRSRAPRAVRASDLWPWLVDTGSLTVRLQRSGARPFAVRVLRQHRARPERGEAALLGMRRGRMAVVREVHLYGGMTARVYARTVIPPRTLRRRPRLAHLGARSLGALLFAERGVRRAPLQIAGLDARHRAYGAAVSVLAAVPPRLWGRRSVFYLGGCPVLVTEVFLPGLTAATAEPTQE